SDSLRSYNQKKQQLELYEKNALSNSEEDEIMINSVNNKFSEFLESGMVSEPIVHVFDELIQRKLIKMPDDKTISYYNSKLNEASKQITRELNASVPLGKKESTSLKEELDKILNNCSQKVEIRAKKLVLIDF